MKYFLVCLAVVGALSIGFAGQRRPIRPTPEDKCPVCGMFTAKHPNFLSEILFKDGSYVTFDGPRDMFRYYLDLSRYEKSRGLTDIASIYVTEYYSLELIDARKAFFVSGSDVRGPMGNELIPFSNEEDAAVFKQDHKGKEIVLFDEVGQGMITGHKDHR